MYKRQPDAFAVLSGDDWLAFPVVAAGGDGLISVVSNEVPAQMTALVRHGLAGELEAAREWQYRLLPLMDANFLETNPTPVKAALAAMGVIEDVLRQPLLSLADDQRPRLHAVLESAGLLEPTEVVA